MSICLVFHYKILFKGTIIYIKVGETILLLGTQHEGLTQLMRRGSLF